MNSIYLFRGGKGLDMEVEKGDICEGRPSVGRWDEMCH